MWWDPETTRNHERNPKKILQRNIKDNGHTEITELTERIKHLKTLKKLKDSY